jgi:hypothetical protein
MGSLTKKRLAIIVIIFIRFKWTVDELMLHRKEIRLPREDHGEPNNKIPFDHPQILFIRRPFTVALVGVCHSSSAAGAADYEDCPMDDG